MGWIGENLMYDTHCHIDLYENPNQIAEDTEKEKITTIAVTNLPSAYFAAKSHMQRFNHLKLAVGLHPLLAINHSDREKELFGKAFKESQFVGEVGLDFSKHGIATKKAQIESFKFVLNLLRQERRFITIHSRKAELEVLSLLNEYRVFPAVFHWYSGSLKVLREILLAGHYLSVNTAMITSKNSMELIQQIPKERLLTETDGPFIKVGNSPAVPRNVKIIHDYLSQLWALKRSDVGSLLEQNFIRCLRQSVQAVS